MVGELVNALPQNSQFLGKLANAAGNEYVVAAQHDLKKTLQKINALLQQEIKNGNVDWIGNLHAAFLAFSREKQGQNQVFSFAKSGNIKVLVARRDAFIDLGKNVADFKNFVSGTVLEHDKIIVCTNELFDALSSQKLLHDMAFFEEEKQFKELFRNKEKELARVSGILFSLVVEKSQAQHERPRAIPHFKIPRLPKFPSIKIALPIVSSPFKRKVALISFFFAVLLMGFGIFKAGEHKTVSATLQKVTALESEKKFLEAWQTFSLLSDSKGSLPKKAVIARQKLESKLFALYKVQEIKKPELLHKITRQETSIVPHSITLSHNFLYVSNPFSSQIFAFDIQQKKGAVLLASKNIKAGVSLLDSAVFFEEPHAFAILTQRALKEINLLENKNMSVESMASFGQYIYLFDSKQGEMIKIANPLNENSILVQWFNPVSAKKAAGAKSISVDGFAWLLSNGNEIQKYYAGAYQQSLKPQIFPPLLRGSRLKTSFGFQYLYLLDPSEKRIILFSKSGQVVKQYTSPVFDGLTDFEVSDDEKIIYLLNGSEIFAIHPSTLL